MNNKILNIISGIALSSVLFMSCEKDISTLNEDPKHPESVPSVNLVVASQQYIADLWVSPSVNDNISRFYTQQWTEVQYVDETNYNFVTRQQPRNHYRILMTDYLGPLNKAKMFLAEEKESSSYSEAQQQQIKTNKIAIIEIMSVFGWNNAVDTFGDIPYTEALSGDSDELIVQPKYDDAASIYTDLITRLEVAINSIDTSLPSYNDNVYHGDMSQWIKFANTLKLQMGLNLSDTDPSTAKSLIETAVAEGVIVDEADNYQYPFEDGIYSNPIFQNMATGRNDFLPADVYIDYMKDNNDPRVPAYFTQDPDGEYTGGVYGELNPGFANFSHVTDRVQAPDYPGLIFDNLYTKFMLAEAAARGFNVGDTAENLYEDAIMTSMTYWGVSDADATAFLAANPYDAANWKSSLGYAAWIGMFNRGIEAWYFFRRMDYPTLEVPGTADGLVHRMPYSNDEYNQNQTNVEAAASAIGGDEYTTKLFWDVN
ncbi:MULTISPECIES: SusD/RagB family nutrient-binding outer membrane lipoprotein [Galbibacter]|uniref:SusD/RagB family nutrient-binding outer membrane lipoprotein n=1 Tax=Galbibacter orientalis TaxID=453852 RepID=UPI003002F082